LRCFLLGFVLIAAFALWPRTYIYAAESPLPLVHIHLLTDEMPSADGTESAVTKRLRQRLQPFPQLKYQIHYVSWPKALAEVAERPDALVYKIARTPARETKYQWLFADETTQLFLYALSSEPLRRHSLDQLRSINALRIACPAQSAHCEMLRHRGFRDSQILEVRLTEQSSVERLLLAKRVRFIAVAEADLRRRMALLGVAPTAYGKGPLVAELEDYLAGGPLLHPGVRQLLSAPVSQSL